VKFRSPGKLRSPQEFRDHWRQVGPGHDCDLTLEGASGPLGQPLEAGRLRIGNRFATHPMEGWDGTRDGRPTEETLRRWRRFGESGAKLIWGGEAFAVLENGRANPHQLFLNDAVDVKGDLSRLREELIAGHRAAGDTEEGLAIGLQLTHSGRFSRPDGAAAPLLAQHIPALDERYGVDPDQPLLGDAELDGIGERFVLAAELAEEVGFDFVDVKCCHGYLLHELLGARSRPGRYGGDFAGRTAFFRRVVEAVRQAAPSLEIAVRVSIADLYPHEPRDGDRVGEPHGWDRALPYDHAFGADRRDPRRFDLDEPKLFLALLRSLGIRLVNLTIGSPYYCPHVQRPAAYPPSDGYLPPEDPLLGVLAHLDCVRECKAAFPELTFVGTGYSYLQ